MTSRIRITIKMNPISELKTTKTTTKRRMPKDENKYENKLIRSDNINNKDYGKMPSSKQISS